MVALSRDQQPSGPAPQRLQRVADDGTGDTVAARAPAKVNLHLSVGQRRADGFHDLQTVYLAVGLYDDVTLAVADRMTVEVHGESADQVPTGDDNLAVRAVRAVAALAGRDADVAIRIDKGIPVAGGMGGGSADAAAALVAADRLFDARLDRATLGQLAAALGSDVPFLLHGGIALGSGRGEIVSPVLARGSYHWVLAVAEEGLSTPRVYAELDAMREETLARDEPAAADGVLAAARTGDVVALGRSLHNDLQPAAVRLRPLLGRLLSAGQESGAVGSVVSGSGPTVALLARDSSDAISIASSLARSGLCRTVRHAVAPVPGAKAVAAQP